MDRRFDNLDDETEFKMSRRFGTLTKRASKVAVKGFMFALGASPVIVGSGIILINHFDSTVVEPAKQKVDENGRLIKGGLDNGAQEVDELKRDGVPVKLTAPETTIEPERETVIDTTIPETTTTLTSLPPAEDQTAASPTTSTTTP